VISVITPVYNGAKYLEESLLSVVKQKVDCEIEIIVIDDCSTDNSREIAEHYTKKVFSNKSRKGAAYSRNRGVEAAKGDYLFFLDSDDYLNDDVFFKLVKIIEQDNLDMVLGMGHDFVSPELSKKDGNGFEIRDKYAGLLIGCILIRKDAFIRVGYFNEELKSGETVDWLIKARNSNIKYKQTDIVTVNRRLHLSNTGRVNRKDEMKNFASILRRKISNKNKPDGPLISIVTPIYNGVPYLKEYEKMILNQKEKSFELIVIDDGSNDETKKYLNEMKKRCDDNNISLICLEQSHAGQAAAFNLALKKVRGKYLTWIDVDDEWDKEFLSKMSKVLNENEDTSIVYCFGKIRNENNQITNDDSFEEVDKLFDAVFYEKINVFAGRFMLKADSLWNIYPNKQIESSPVGQNLQLLLPISYRNRCALVREHLHTYNHSSNSASTIKLTFSEKRDRILELKRLYEKLLEYCDNSDAYRKEIDIIIDNCLQCLYKESTAKAIDEITDKT